MALKIGFGRAVASLALPLVAACSRPPASPQSPPNTARTLARSIAILRSATRDHPRVLKILFYGQSISTRRWTDQAMASLRAAYPNVRFDYRNLAIGGWSAIALERAVKRDIAEAYPDLIVFHVYGDHRAYERIIRLMRSTTTADIVIQTDHVVSPVEPLCDTGLHLRWSPPPGCMGHLWFKQHVWEDYMSGRKLPELAVRYGLALEPRRQRWNAWLHAHHLPPAALIADAPHPNERGWTLMAALFTSWLERLVASPRVPTPDPVRVRSLAPPRPGASSTYAFDGNRIELLAAGPLDGKVTVRIDGKPPQALDGCWQNSRVSRLPTMPDWPGLKQVSVDPSFHRADRWRLRIDHLDPAQDSFAFTLVDATGEQGSGTADARFTSRDGVVTIDPQDWMLAMARAAKGRGVPEGTTLSWERRFACGDQQPVSLDSGPDRVEQRYVVATGLANTHHVVTLTLGRDAPPVGEVRVYRPSL